MRKTKRNRTSMGRARRVKMKLPAEEPNEICKPACLEEIGCSCRKDADAANGCTSHDIICREEILGEKVQHVKTRDTEDEKKCDDQPQRTSSFKISHLTTNDTNSVVGKKDSGTEATEYVNRPDANSGNRNSGSEDELDCGCPRKGTTSVTVSRATPRLDTNVTGDNHSSDDDDMYDMDTQRAATAASGTTYHPTNAKHPHYSNRINRLNSMSRWTNPRRGNLDEAVEAGLFFPGEGQDLLCHYCGVRVPALRSTDVAWIEHAKFNPTCGFVRFTKGDAFVRTMVDLYDLEDVVPSVNNPRLRNRHSSMPHSSARGAASPRHSRVNEASQSAASRPTLDLPPASHVRAQSFPLMAAKTSVTPTQPRVPRMQVQAREVRARLDLDSAQHVIKMGFSPDLVGAVIAQQLIYEGDDFKSFSDLVHAVMAAAELGDKYPVEHYARGLAEPTSKRSELKPKTGPAPTSKVTNSNSAMTLSIGASSWSDSKPSAGSDEVNNKLPPDVNSSTLALEIENRELKERKMCKICFENDTDTIFMPCGHLAVCHDCSKPLSQCPLCRKEIAAALKVTM